MIIKDSGLGMLRGLEYGCGLYSGENREAHTPRVNIPIYPGDGSAVAERNDAANQIASPFANGGSTQAKCAVKYIPPVHNLVLWSLCYYTQNSPLEGRANPTGGLCRWERAEIARWPSLVTRFPPSRRSSARGQSSSLHLRLHTECPSPDTVKGVRLTGLLCFRLFVSTFSKKLDMFSSDFSETIFLKKKNTARSWDQYIVSLHLTCCLTWLRTLPSHFSGNIFARRKSEVPGGWGRGEGGGKVLSCCLPWSFDD